MIDPSAAIGLACNIIQLVTFIGDIISKSHGIYESADGQLVEHQELESITRYLNELTKDVKNRSPTKSGKALDVISQQCVEQSEDLLRAIAGLKVHGRNKKWNSFRQALNCVLKESEIDGIKKRLSESRAQLNTALLQTLQNDMRLMGQNQEEIKRNETQNEKLERERVEAERQKQDELREQLSYFMQDTESWHAELRNELKRNNWQAQNSTDVAQFSTIFSKFVSKEMNKTKLEEESRQMMQMHEMLRFTHMEDRYEDIPRAYQQTFEWIYQENGQKQNESSGIDQEIVWDSFTEWLEGNQSLYWITGKPGAGKSTLMKFLYDDRRTFKHLKHWTGSCPTITAAFFFWNSGASMQMSRMDMMQSILHQALENHLDLIPEVFPLRWKRCRLFGADLRPLTLTELFNALKYLVSKEEYRIVLFIDGLDEFTDSPREFAGDCAELADLILQLSVYPSVKICTGSRPWNVFEDKFAGHARLKIHELTRQDVQLFVSEELGNSQRFKEVEDIDEEEVQKLVKAVADRASGVFLWVDLVVRSLIEGLRDGDDISDLHERLLELPLNLEKLFESILDRLDKRYFEQASKLFQLVNAAVEPPSLLTLYFSRTNFDDAIDAPNTLYNGEGLQKKAKVMKRRINSRCKGLLEVSRSNFTYMSPVNYLHRTVKDYFQKPGTWARILAASEDFNANEALARAYLLNLKTMNLQPNARMLREFWVIVCSAVTYIDAAQQTPTQDKVIYMDEMDRVARQLFNEDASQSEFGISRESCLDKIAKDLLYSLSSPQTDLYWTETLFQSGVPDFRGCRKHVELPVKSIFEFCFRAALLWYIEAKLKDDRHALGSPKVGGLSLLSAAIYFGHTSLIPILLKSGANPNLVEGDGSNAMSPWIRLLAQAPPEVCSGDILEAFIDHDADLNAKIIGTGDKAFEKVKVLMHDLPKEETECLMRKLSEKTYIDEQYDQGPGQSKPDVRQQSKGKMKRLFSAFVSGSTRRK